VRADEPVSTANQSGREDRVLFWPIDPDGAALAHERLTNRAIIIFEHTRPNETRGILLAHGIIVLDKTQQKVAFEPRHFGSVLEIRRNGTTDSAGYRYANCGRSRDDGSKSSGPLQ